MKWVPDISPFYKLSFDFAYDGFCISEKHSFYSLWSISFNWEEELLKQAKLYYTGRKGVWTWENFTLEGFLSCLIPSLITL